jgi:hypothetical protein
MTRRQHVPLPVHSVIRVTAESSGSAVTLVSPTEWALGSGCSILRRRCLVLSTCSPRRYGLRKRLAVFIQPRGCSISEHLRWLIACQMDSGLD